MERQMQVDMKELSRKTYTIREVSRVLGISRTALMWYEEKGVVCPRRASEGGWREYTMSDILHLMGAFLLKNTGVPASTLSERLGEDPFSPEGLDVCMERARLREEYYRAQRECLAGLKELHERAGTVEVVDVEPYYISFDSSERGYHNYPDGAGMSPIIANVPIGSIGALVMTPWRQFPVDSRWGRTVPVRFAHLIEGLPEGLEVIGGKRCVRYAHESDSPFDERASLDEVYRQMAVVMEREGLVADGTAFCPFMLPYDRSFLSSVCLPVRPA